MARRELHNRELAANGTRTERLKTGADWSHGHCDPRRAEFFALPIRGPHLNQGSLQA